MQFAFSMKQQLTHRVKVVPHKALTVLDYKTTIIVLLHIKGTIAMCSIIRTEQIELRRFI